MTRLQHGRPGTAVLTVGRGLGPKRGNPFDLRAVRRDAVGNNGRTNLRCRARTAYQAEATYRDRWPGLRQGEGQLHAGNLPPYVPGSRVTGGGGPTAAQMNKVATGRRPWPPPGNRGALSPDGRSPGHLP